MIVRMIVMMVNMTIVMMMMMMMMMKIMKNTHIDIIGRRRCESKSARRH